MAVTSALFSDALDKAMTKMFVDAYREVPLEFSQLYGIESSSTYQEKLSSASTIGNIPKHTGGSITEVNNEQLYDKTFTHEEYAAKYVVERKLADDNKWKQIFDGIYHLGRAARITKEENAMSVFNDAFTAEPSDGDGCELCASDHPYSPTDSNTQSNEGTTTLAATAIGATRTLMRKFKLANGKRANVQPDMIIVPIDLEDTAKELTMSTAKVATSYSSGIYNYEKGVKVFPSMYLTDTNNWFLVDSTLMKRNLIFYKRIPLEYATTNDFDTMQKWARVYERYIYGWYDWRWIYGHKVA